MDFALQLAGRRNVKAARTVFDDYEGNVSKMKEAEPCIFAKHSSDGNASGSTGPLNARAGAARARP